MSDAREPAPAKVLKAYPPPPFSYTGPVDPAARAAADAYAAGVGDPATAVDPQGDGVVVHFRRRPRAALVKFFNDGRVRAAFDAGPGAGGLVFREEAPARDEVLAYLDGRDVDRQAAP